MTDGNIKSFERVARKYQIDFSLKKDASETPPNDNPGAKSQGIKQLMSGGGVILIGTQLIPLLSGLF